MKRVSVCMATYNGENYIFDQINSILSQLNDDDELLISDDSSSDSTIAIIKSFSDSRIKLFENSGFNNHIKNFEFVLSKSIGRYIFMSDQDDLWQSNKVSLCLQALKSSNLVNSDCVLINAKNEIISDSLFLKLNSSAGFLKNFIKNSYVGCCMAFDRKILDLCLPFPPYINSHDTWIGLVAECFGKTIFLKEPLIRLRRHGFNFSDHAGQDTFLTNKSPFRLSEILFARFILLYSIINRFIHVKIKS
jgi:glycosyltransferase involved in cell wall biosynthesis